MDKEKEKVKAWLEELRQSDQTGWQTGAAIGQYARELGVEEQELPDVFLDYLVSGQVDESWNETSRKVFSEMKEDAAWRLLSRRPDVRELLQQLGIEWPRQSSRNDREEP